MSNHSCQSPPSRPSATLMTRSFALTLHHSAWQHPCSLATRRSSGGSQTKSAPAISMRTFQPRSLHRRCRSGDWGCQAMVGPEAGDSFAFAPWSRLFSWAKTRSVAKRLLNMSHLLRLPSGLKLMNLFFRGWTALAFAFLYFPIILLVFFFFNVSVYNLDWEGFTMRWYAKMANDRVLVSGLKNSLIIASVTTVLAVVLGTVGAWLLYKYRFP